MAEEKLKIIPLASLKDAEWQLSNIYDKITELEKNFNENEKELRGYAEKDRKEIAKLEKSIKSQSGESYTAAVHNLKTLIREYEQAHNFQIAELRKDFNKFIVPLPNEDKGFIGIEFLYNQLNKLRGAIMAHLKSHKFYDDRGGPVQSPESKKINAVLDKQIALLTPRADFIAYDEPLKKWVRDLIYWLKWKGNLQHDPIDMGLERLLHRFDGKTEKKERCMYCNGSGIRVDKNHIATDCSYCKGTGIGKASGGEMTHKEAVKYEQDHPEEFDEKPPEQFESYMILEEDDKKRVIQCNKPPEPFTVTATKVYKEVVADIIKKEKDSGDIKEVPINSRTNTFKTDSKPPEHKRTTKFPKDGKNYTFSEPEITPDTPKDEIHDFIFNKLKKNHPEVNFIEDAPKEDEPEPLVLPDELKPFMENSKVTRYLHNTFIDGFNKGLAFERNRNERENKNSEAVFHFELKAFNDKIQELIKESIDWIDYILISYENKDSIPKNELEAERKILEAKRK